MTLEQRQKIFWLNRAFYAEKLARALMDKRDRDKALAERISKCTDGSGGTCAGNSTEDALLRLADTEHKLQDKLRSLVALRDEIADAITSIKDPELEAILIRRYLNYEPMEVIAERMHYARMTIHRKHLQALDRMLLNVTSESDTMVS